MAVAYDSSGASQGTGGVSSFSQPFTAAAGADVFLAIAGASASAPTFSSVQYNGTAMTLMKSLNTAATGSVALYRLAGGGTGSSANFTGSLSTSSWVSLEWASYTGVASAATAVFTTATTTSPSTGSISCTAGQMIVAAIFGCSTTIATMSSPTGGTNRQLGQTSTSYSSMALSDSTSTATFGATMSASQFCATIATVLSPPAGTTVSPATATVAITGSTPTITGFAVTVSPAAATVTLTGGTPAITGTPTVVSPTSATVTLSGGTPWVIKNPFDVVLGKLAQGVSTSILCVGDSTVYGYNDAAQSTLYGWTGRLGVALAAYFNANAQVMTLASASPNAWTTASTTHTSTVGGSAPTISILNAGVDGATLSSLSTFEADYFSNPASGSVIDLIFIGDGLNETVAAVGAAYLSFVEYAQGKLPGVPIVVTTENNTTVTSEPFAGRPLFTDIFAAIITEFLPGKSQPLSPPVQQSTAASLTWMIDSQQANIPASEITNAGIHPNDQGYQVYANYLLSQLVPLSVGATMVIGPGTPSIGLTVAPAGTTVSVTTGTPTILVRNSVTPTSAVIAIAGGTPVVVVAASSNYSGSPASAVISIRGWVPAVSNSSNLVASGSWADNVYGYVLFVPLPTQAGHSTVGVIDAGVLSTELTLIPGDYLVISDGIWFGNANPKLDKPAHFAPFVFQCPARGAVDLNEIVSTGMAITAW